MSLWQAERNPGASWGQRYPGSQWPEDCTYLVLYGDLSQWPMLDGALLVIWKPLLVLEGRVLCSERGPRVQRDCDTFKSSEAKNVTTVPAPPKHSGKGHPPALIPQLPVGTCLREWAVGRSVTGKVTRDSMTGFLRESSPVLCSCLHRKCLCPKCRCQGEKNGSFRHSCLVHRR